MKNQSVVLRMGSESDTDSYSNEKTTKITSKIIFFLRFDVVNFLSSKFILSILTIIFFPTIEASKFIL